MKPFRAAAVIPAAGLSSRMHGFKPLLALGGKTIIEHVIGLFKCGGITEIVVVAGYRSEELIPVVEAASCHYVIHHDYHSGMFSSIQRGVKELSGRYDAFFLLPVDIPLVHPDTLRHLQKAFCEQPEARICYPQFQSRRGHPPLICSSLVPIILSFDGNGGMRELMGRYEQQAIDVPVDDPYIRRDVDTPDDFLRLEEDYRAMM